MLNMRADTAFTVCKFFLDENGLLPEEGHLRLEEEELLLPAAGNLPLL